MTPQCKNILLVDDHPIVYEGLRAILAGTPDLKLIGTCPSFQEAREFLRTGKPDLIIMDISLTDTNGLIATRGISRTHPQIPILILTCHDEKVCASMAFSAGAKGLIMKDQPGDEILKAIRTVLQGHSYRPAQPPDTPRVLSSRSAVRLSKKELEILDYIVAGYTTTRMALALDVSLKTIETHRLNIRNKLGVENQKELVRWAIMRRSSGMADPG